MVSIGVQPDGLNINKDVGSTSPADLIEKVLEEEADLGIAFDGDGDRVVMVDHKGELLDGDELIYIIAQNRKESGRLVGGVVGTLLTHYGAELAFESLGIPFLRTTVGNHYVLEQLTKHDGPLGREGSGHLFCFY